LGKSPWDLYLVAAYSAAVAIALLSLEAGLYLTVFLIAFVPGYLLIAAIFPADKQIDWTERVALSIGLSLAVAAVVGLGLSFTPWGIRFVPLTVVLTTVTLVSALVAYRRRMRLPSNLRLSAKFDLRAPAWREYETLDKALVVGLGAGIIVAFGTLGYILTTPAPADRFSEFYILGSSGNASDYPTRLNVSERAAITLGLANHELAATTYTLRIDLVGVRIVSNITTGLNETVDLNRTNWSWFNISLENSQTWTQPYAFQIETQGLWKVQFLLFKDQELAAPYQELHLLIRVPRG